MVITVRSGNVKATFKQSFGIESWNLIRGRNYKASRQLTAFGHWTWLPPRSGRSRKIHPLKWTRLIPDLRISSQRLTFFISTIYEHLIGIGGRLFWKMGIFLFTNRVCIMCIVYRQTHTPYSIWHHVRKSYNGFSIHFVLLTHSFVYTSGHCRRWRSRMEVKIMARSLFVHCKIAYFYSVTTKKRLVVSLPNFETMRKTHLSKSCKIFSSIRTTKLKIHAIEFCDFVKDFVVPSGLFVPCSLTVTRTWRPRLTAHCPIGERH